MSDGSPAARVARFGRKVMRHLRARIAPRTQPAILMYHRVADERFDPWGTIVSPARFHEQVAWIARHRTPLPLDEFAELHRAGKLPKDAIALTFDDGYSDNGDTAVPLLRQHGVPATIFLPAEWIENGKPFWWDEVADVVFSHDGPSLTLGTRTFALGEQSAGDRVWKHSAAPSTPRQRAFSQLWEELIAREPEAREAALAKLREQFRRGNVEALPRPLSISQIRELASDEVNFGSHTLTHPDLTRLQPDQRRHEIIDSLQRCEALIGKRPTSFAYPYGIFDQGCEQLVREAGFACACSTETAAVTAGARVHALPRVQVGNWSAQYLSLRLGLL